MIQYRRLAALLTGVWLGASILADVAVTQNFQTVDRYLQNPGTVAATVELKDIGKAEARSLLRRNAAEENNWIFENWELAELGIGAILLLLLVFGDRPNMTMIVLAALMFFLVGTQHFVLSKKIADLGRQMPETAKDSVESKTFWMLHGFYSGSELLKLALGLGLGLRISTRSRPDTDRFKRQYENERAVSRRPV